MVLGVNVLKYSQTLNKRASKNGKDTHFGYQRVSTSEKTSMVHEVFSSVANQYDLMNDLMSFGIHRIWKSDLLKMIKSSTKLKIVDIGGGTGDISHGISKKMACELTLIDINPEMLSVGRDREINHGKLNNIKWICGNAEMLPFSDNYADIFVTAFCLRNVTNLKKSLLEANRILKPGGRFFCLEFSKVTLPIFKQLYSQYSFKLLPMLGQTITGNREAYQYLVESIQNFPDQRAFSEMILEAGLTHVKYRTLTCGIATIHSAWQI